MPKYQTVIDWIKKEISDGNLKDGDKLPVERELCARFELSRQTVRRALDELEAGGVISRVQGSGSYVGTNLKQNISSRERKMNIAVMATFIDSYIFPPVVKGITGFLNERGYSTQLTFTDDDVIREEEILKALIETDSIDGLIAEPSKAALPNHNIKYYEELRKRNIPVLFINAQYPGVDIPCIRLDDRGIACSAVHLLADAGFKRIGGIFHGVDEQGHARYEGYFQGMKEADLKITDSYVLWLDSVSAGNLEPLSDYFLSRLKDCQAVICYNDEIAYQFIRMCRKHGIKVPEDISVVGFDDADISRRSRPKITTFPHPKDILGRRAAATMLAMLDDPDAKADFLYLPEPVIRNSVKL